MGENQAVKKRNFPLALLLMIAHVALNWRRLLGLLSFSTALPMGEGGTAAVGASGIIGILSYISKAVIAIAPVVMAVLLFMHATKDTEIRKAMSLLCLALAIAFLLDFARMLYFYLVVTKMSFYDTFPNLGSIAAPLVLGVGMLNLFFKLRRDKLSKLKSYGLLFYYLMLFEAVFMIMPMFMDMSVELNISGLSSNLLLIAAGFFLPATILEDGKKSRPVDMVGLLATVFVAFCLFVLGGTLSYSSYADSHSMPGVTTVSCPSCHKKYTDNGNKRSIERSGMCSNCKIGFEATKDALGW